MRYLSEMRIYFKAHFALLSDAQYWANTSNALECCNRFTHNGRSNGNLAHKATLPLELQYHNPAKSSFVCVSAIHPPSPPERWRSPRIGRQLVEPGRYYGGALRTTPAPLRTPRTYIGAALRRPPTTPLSVARTYFAGTAPSNALHVQFYYHASTIPTLDHFQKFLNILLWEPEIRFLKVDAHCTEGQPAKKRERKLETKWKTALWARWTYIDRASPVVLLFTCH